MDSPQPHDMSTCPFVTGSETLDFRALTEKVEHAMQLTALLADATVATASAVMTKVGQPEMRRVRIQAIVNGVVGALVLAMTLLILSAVLPQGPIYRSNQRQTGRAVASIILCVENHDDHARNPSVPLIRGCP